MPPDVAAVEPILAAADVPATLAWWRDTLGASDVWEWRAAAGEPVTHGGFALGRARLQVGHGTGEAGGAAIFFKCGFTSAAALDAYAAAVGDAVTRPPADEPWGYREFHVRDPAGRLLRFAGPVARDVPDRSRARVTVEHRRPSVAEYRRLVTAVGWAASSALPRAAERLAGMRHGVVAVVDGEVVGCALIVSDGVNNAHLADVAVLPEQQGRGVGSAMLRAVLGWCGEHLEPSAILSLTTGRGTVPFYERFGFSGDAAGVGLARRNGRRG